MKRGWWLSCLAVFGCSEEGGALLPPGSTSSNFWAMVAHVDGSPAASGLVYDISTSQSELLIRTDGAGRFELDEAPERLLVRSGFDEVEITEAPRSGMTINLANTKDRPETLNIKGVGMEQSYLRGATKLYNNRLVNNKLYMTHWNQEEQRIELTVMDITTDVVAVIRSEPMPSEPTSILWADEIGVFWYFATLASVRGDGPWNFILANARTAQVVVEDEVDGPSLPWTHNGDYVDLVEKVRFPRGRSIWRHRRVDMNRGSLEIHDIEEPIHSATEVIGHRGRFYYCGFVYDLSIYDPNAKRFEPAGGRGRVDCPNAWRRPNELLLFSVGTQLELWSPENGTQYTLPLPASLEGREWGLIRGSFQENYAVLNLGSQGREAHVLVDLIEQQVIDLTDSFANFTSDLSAHQRGGEVYIRGIEFGQPFVARWRPGDTRVAPQSLSAVHDTDKCYPSYWSVIESNELDFYACYDRELDVGSLFEAGNTTRRGFFGYPEWQQRDGERLFYNTDLDGEAMLVSVSRNDPR